MLEGIARQLQRCASWVSYLDRATLLRGLRVAAVVGSVLVLINQGDALLSGNFHDVHLGKLLLTYCVPFLVSTYSAVQARAALDHARQGESYDG